MSEELNYTSVIQWRILDEGITVPKTPNKSIYFGFNNEDINYCIVCGPDCDANAKLIVASPELLEKAERFLRMYTSVFGEPDEWDEYFELKEAINKAKGL